jgi:hypothetical protein
MTKEHRVKAMGRVITACQQFKDKKPLAEAVRQIVEELRAEEAEFRVKARAEHEANLAAKTTVERSVTDAP